MVYFDVISNLRDNEPFQTNAATIPPDYIRKLYRNGTLTWNGLNFDMNYKSDRTHWRFRRNGVRINLDLNWFFLFKLLHFFCSTSYCTIHIKTMKKEEYNGRFTGINNSLKKKFYIDLISPIRASKYSRRLILTN